MHNKEPFPVAKSDIASMMERLSQIYGFKASDDEKAIMKLSSTTKEPESMLEGHSHYVWR